MTNNDCLRRIRSILDLDESAMAAVFSHAGQQITPEVIVNMLKEDGDADAAECTDTLLAAFLNGLIIEKRGAQESNKLLAEERLTNNIIFRKLRIALDLQTDDILTILALAGCSISKHQLSAFFRNPDSRKFRVCDDHILQSMLAGLQIKQDLKNKRARVT